MIRMSLETFLRETSKHRKFKVDKAYLEDSLRMILEKQPIDLWGMLKNSDEDFEGIVAIIMQLHDKKMVNVFENGKIVLTPKGKEFAKKLVPVTLPKSYKTRYSYPIPKPMQKILKRIKRIYKEVNPKDEYEQGSLRPEASVRKVTYAINRGDIAGKRVVCVGDDDILSLIMGMTGLPKSILAVDIDDDILSTIRKHGKRLSVPITTINHNLCYPIPSKFRGKYDTFLTQPPDTVLGYTLFLSRGVELLKRESGMIGYGGLTPTACPRRALIEIQNIIVKMGLVQTDYVRKFCEYPPLRTEIKKVEVPDYIPYPPSKLWYVSDLQRLKTTTKTKPYYKGMVKGDIADYKHDERIYGR
jgi:predicted methyltransferase